MKNTIKLFVVIALVAVIGFTMASCSNDSTSSSSTSGTYTVFETSLFDSEFIAIAEKSPIVGDLVFSDKSKDAALAICNSDLAANKQTGVSYSEIESFLNGTGLTSVQVNQILTKLQSNSYVLVGFGEAADDNKTLAAFKD